MKRVRERVTDRRIGRETQIDRDSEMKKIGKETETCRQTDVRIKKYKK